MRPVVKTRAPGAPVTQYQTLYNTSQLPRRGPLDSQIGVRRCTLLVPATVTSDGPDASPRTPRGRSCIRGPPDTSRTVVTLAQTSTSTQESLKFRLLSGIQTVTLWPCARGSHPVPNFRTSRLAEPRSAPRASVRATARTGRRATFALTGRDGRKGQPTPAQAPLRCVDRHRDPEQRQLRSAALEGPLRSTLRRCHRSTRPADVPQGRELLPGRHRQ